MRELMKTIEEMKEELHGAKHYAMCYQRYKTEDSVMAKRFLDMAQDELKHAMYLHDIASEELQDIKEGEKTLEDYLDELWNEKHDMYMDKMAKVKTMLSA